MAIQDKLQEALRKLPFLKKAMGKHVEEEEEEVDEEEEEVESEDEDEQPARPNSRATPGPAWKAQLAKQLPFLAKYLGAAPGSPEDRTDPGIQVEGAKKGGKDPAAKRQLIIRAVLGLGLAFFLLDMFISGEESPTDAPAPTEAPKPKKPKRPRPGTPPATTETPGTAEAPATSETPSTTEAPATSETPSTTEAPATPETPSTTEAPATSETPSTTEAPATSETPSTTEALTTTETPSTTEAPATTETSTATDVPDSIEVPVTTDTPTSEGPDVTGVGAESNPGGEAGNGDDVGETTRPGGGAGEDMTEKILEDLEKQVQAKADATAGEVPAAYVPPPEYDFAGRGLVYNCKGKHWACVDGASYRVCQQNHRALKAQRKAKECFPDSVYQSEASCAWVQRRKINGNAKADFCD